MSRDAVVAFHHPRPLADPRRARGATELRPAALRAAFEGLGLEVVELTGYSRERARRCRELLRSLDRGHRIVGVYGEYVTTPTAMSDPHHLPLRPAFDARFFAAMRRAGVPTGIFYGDIFWLYRFYRETVAAPKRWAAVAAYRYDLWWYRRFVDVLFVPSRELADKLPHRLRHPHPVELPPGCTVVDHPVRRPQPGRLRLLHVGGATPPTYDLEPLLEAVSQVDGVTLLVCCPPDHADAVRSSPHFDAARVEIVHARAAEVGALYRRTDVACAGFGGAYQAIAVPVKSIEAMGHGVPLLLRRPSAAARLVEREGHGWVVGDDELVGLLKRLRDDPSAVAEASERARAARDRHTWQQRARQVLEVFTEVGVGAGGES